MKTPVSNRVLSRSARPLARIIARTMSIAAMTLLQGSLLVSQGWAQEASPLVQLGTPIQVESIPVATPNRQEKVEYEVISRRSVPYEVPTSPRSQYPVSRDSYGAYGAEPDANTWTSHYQPAYQQREDQPAYSQNQAYPVQTAVSSQRMNTPQANAETGFDPVYDADVTPAHGHHGRRFPVAMMQPVMQGCDTQEGVACTSPCCAGCDNGGCPLFYRERPKGHSYERRQMIKLYNRTHEPAWYKKYKCCYFGYYPTYWWAWPGGWMDCRYPQPGPHPYDLKQPEPKSAGRPDKDLSPPPRGVPRRNDEDAGPTPLSPPRRPDAFDSDLGRPNPLAPMPPRPLN